MPTCSVRGCKNPVRSNGLCHMHHQRWVRHGNPLVVLRKQNITHPDGGDGCSVEGCSEKFYCHGFCRRHYQRWRRYGDPNHNHTEEVLRFIEAALSHRDGCLLWPFKSKAGKGYARARINGEDQYVHRYICQRVHGPAPSLIHEVAHSCGKGHLACIAPQHVRWATPKENEADKVLHGTRKRRAA